MRLGQSVFSDTKPLAEEVALSLFFSPSRFRSTLGMLPLVSLFANTLSALLQDTYTWTEATDKASRALFMTELARGMMMTISYYFKPKGKQAVLVA